ncbi:GAF domain-containing protein [bacterium]|nr:GAF domain-containing protein [bacterium]
MDNLAGWDRITIVQVSDLKSVYQGIVPEFDAFPTYPVRTLLWHKNKMDPNAVPYWPLQGPISRDKIVLAAVTQGCPIVHPDVMNQRPESWRPIAGVTDDIVSWLVLPLIHGGQVVGIITLDSLHPRYEDLNLYSLERFAALAAKAIHEVQQAVVQRSLLQALDAISQSHWSNTPGEISDSQNAYRVIAEMACKLVRGSFSYFIPLHEDHDGKFKGKGKTIVYPPGDESTLPEHFREHYNPEAKESGITGLAIKRKRLVLLNDIQDTVNNQYEEDEEALQRLVERYTPPEQRIQSNLVIGVYNEEGKPIGILNVESTTPYAFSQFHLESITEFVKQAALILEKDSLYNQLQQFYDASKRAIQTSDSRVLLRQIVQDVYEISGASWVSLILVDSSTPSTNLPREIYPPDFLQKQEHVAAGDPIIREGGHSRWVMEHKKKIIISDVQQGPSEDYLDQDDKRIEINPRTQRMGIRAVLCLPIIPYPDAILGVIWLHYRQPQSFPKARIAVIESFVNHCVIAYSSLLQKEELSRQKQKSERLLSYYREVSQIGTDVEALLETTAGEAIQSVAPDVPEKLKSSGIYLYDPDKEEVELFAQANRDDRLEKRFSIAKGQGVAAQVIRDQPSPLVVKDYQTWPHRIQKHADTGSLKYVVAVRLEVPREHEEPQILGALYVNIRDETFTGLSSDDEERLKTLAEGAARQLALARRLRHAEKYREEVEADRYVEDDLVFVVMPFRHAEESKNQELNTIFNTITEAVGIIDPKLYVVRSDKDPEARLVAEEIKQYVRRAKYVVAILTYARPNVYYEIGFAEAYNFTNKILLFLQEQPSNVQDVNRDDYKVHFDIAHLAHQTYKDANELFRNLIWKLNAIHRKNSTS